MKALRVAALVTVVGVGVGCSGQGPPCNPCGGSGSASTPPITGTNLNPNGVAYPNPPSGYGRSARSGSTPGSVMQNFKFLGYRNGDRSQGLQTISLADYYDPCAKTYTLLRVSVAGVWCVPCNEETSAIVADQAMLASEHVVIIQALDDGRTEGVGATVNDLNFWVTSHQSNFTEMLDPGLTNLGGFFPASEIPWNCDIDPRTMEILDDATGWSGDLNLDLTSALSTVTGPPGYPIPVTCP